MSGNHNSSGNSLHELSELKPAKKEDREERRSTATESAFGVGRLSVEQRPDNKTIRNDDEDFSPQRRFVAPNEPELSPRAGLETH